MPLGTAAALLPTAVSLGANLLGNRRPSGFEKRLNRMADIFESEGSKPITENRDFKAGMKLVGERDKRNRRAIDNRSAVTGATDESRIATLQSANEQVDANIGRLLQNAQRYRELMQNRALRTRGMKEQAKQFRNQQFGQKLNSIVQPLGQAMNAFNMAGVFNNSTGASGPAFTGRQPQNLPGMFQSGSLPQVNPSSIFSGNQANHFQPRSLTNFIS